MKDPDQDQALIQELGIVQDRDLGPKVPKEERGKDLMILKGRSKKLLGKKLQKKRNSKSNR